MNYQMMSKSRYGTGGFLFRSQKVHSTPQIEVFRAEHPDGVVVVHPECPMEVVAADANGSTEFIRRFVRTETGGLISQLELKSTWLPDSMLSMRISTSNV